MKTIPLTQGYVAIVDESDFDELSASKWHVILSGKRRAPYASRGVYQTGRKQPVRVMMHVALLGGARDGWQVDHINGNTLDNRRENLRWSQRSDNSCNRGANSVGKSASRFKGVTFEKRLGKWRARIGKNRERWNIGLFATETEAAEAYNREAMRVHGAFARLNPIAPAA